MSHESSQHAGGSSRVDAGPTPRERFRLYVREDVRDTVRERQAYVLATLFALVGVGVAYSAGQLAGQQPSGQTIQLIPRLLTPLALLVPLVALGFVAPVIVERRTTGALTVLLGLPFSRRTVVAGTLVARSLVVAGTTLLGMALAVPVAIAMGVSVDPIAFVAVAAALVALAAAFTAIAVAISAVSRTSTRATAGAFGAYVLFAFDLWQWLPRLVVYVYSGFEFPATFPAWVDVVAALNPMTAFTNALAGVSTELAGGIFAQPPQEPAAYEEPAVAAAVLLAWIVVATWAGARRFRATDL